MFNYRLISHINGILVIILAISMFLSTLIGYAFGDTESTGSLVYSGIITMMLGSVLILFGRGYKDRKTYLKKREGYLIVTSSWIAMWFVAAFPYIFSGYFESITDASFESISGLTTTGASIINDIEAIPKGLLFWRSLTQWLGGMGIIVLTVALLPILGIGGVELFVAEAPGPTSDKIHPRIQETARRLWLIYVALTVVCAILLMMAGMNLFDAVNHALTTLATGGFSTKNASVDYFTNPAIHYIIIVFMFLAGNNYTVTYFMLKGKFKRGWASEEFRTYLYLTLALGFFVFISIMRHHIDTMPVELAFRDAFFQVVSVVTTTGFVTADYTEWSEGLAFLFVVMMFIGACAGSTSGGIKIIRHIVFVKNIWFEFNRILHPRGLIRTKVNKRVVPPRILTHILVFLLVYLMLFVGGTFLCVIFGMDILSAIGATATSLSNVGPGIGTVGPLNNFYEVPDAAKWVLGFLMLAGRLELFSVLVVLTPFFWRRN